MSIIRPQDRMKVLKSIASKNRLTDKALAEAIENQSGIPIPYSTLWGYLHGKWKVRKPDHLAAIDRFIVMNTKTGDSNEQNNSE